MTKYAKMVQTQCDHAVVAVADNSTTVFDGLCVLYGIYVNTALSAHALPIQDGTQTTRTNMCLQSEVFGTTWVTGSSSVNADVATAPDGTTTADRLNVTVATATHYVAQAITTVATTTYTASCYIKDDGARYVGISSTDAPEHFISVLADLSLGAVVATDVGATSGTIVDSGIEDAGGGWYRLWITGNHNESGSNFFYVYTSDSDSPTFTSTGQVSYLGVAGEDALCWGAQFELGTTLTEYIPTTDAARSADYPVVVLPASTAAGTYKEFPGIRFNESLFVNPDDTATGDIEIIYRRVNPN